MGRAPADRQRDLDFAAGPSRSHRTVKAEAMERLMPAQQWISSGACASQSAAEGQQPVDMVAARADFAGRGIGDVVDAQLEMAVGGESPPASRSCALATAG